MITLTKEWLLRTIAELEEERDATPGAVNEDAAMALAAMKLALASLEAEPVYFINRVKHSDAYGDDVELQTYCCELDALKSKDDFGGDVVPVYAAPPAPVSVPDDVSGPLAHAYKELTPMFMRNHIDVFERYGIYPDGSVGIQAMRIALDGMTRRAAMLQGAEPAITSCTLRDAVELIRNSGIEIDAEKILAERDALNAPDCWCHTCRPVTIADMRFVVCPDCGNKRCPHASDHRNACTGSNEPGQEGSAYPAAPQQEVE